MEIKRAIERFRKVTYSASSPLSSNRESKSYQTQYYNHYVHQIISPCFHAIPCSVKWEKHFIYQVGFVLKREPWLLSLSASLKVETWRKKKVEPEQSAKLVECTTQWKLILWWMAIFLGIFLKKKQQKEFVP